MRRRRVLALGGTAAVGLVGYDRYVGSIGDGVADVASKTADSAEGLSQGDGSSDRSSRPGPATDPPRLGATLNGRPRRLRDDLALIEKSNTQWLHAFLDVRKKLDADVSPREDPDVVALRQAAGEMDTNLIVSLRWDFRGIWGDKEPQRVPEAGSNREAALFEYATKLLKAIDTSVKVLVLGNEPIWETLDEDLIEGDGALVGFTRRLKEHLVRHYAGDDTWILLGAFNRLYDDDIWMKYNGFYRRLFQMVRKEDRIDGIDVHLHYSDIEETKQMLTLARQAIPDGTITVTEFSPMWRYVEKLDTRIDEFEGGGAFVKRHGLPGGMTVRQFFRTAKDTPRPRQQMGDFMATMSWYNENLVTDMHDVLAEYDVDIGTLGFMLDKGVHNVEWDEDWRPFQISYLFLRPLIDTEDGAHPHYIDPYRKRT